MSDMHDPDCRWQRTTLEECEYRATHFYCPHPEHACNCAAPPDRVKSDYGARLRSLAERAAPTMAEALLEMAAEHEAWEREVDKRN